MKTVVVLLSALLALAIADIATACGDSLYRVGQGIAYREYSAPLPGKVLIYARAPSAGDLATALARSGHHVRVVGDEIALGVELKTSAYDVVIAPYSEHTAVEGKTNNTTTRYLPIARSKAESDAAGKDYEKVMVAESHEVKHFLKAIHQILEGKLT